MIGVQVAGLAEVDAAGAGGSEPGGQRQVVEDAVGDEGDVGAVESGAKDSGYVMVFVHDPDRGATDDLVILAAQDFTSEPVARVHLPARVPLRVHSWIADP